MLIPYSWLKEFVNLRKSAEQVASNLSLVSVGVEGVQKTGSDKVLDLDITYNRGDLLSVIGVARELAAIYELPLKGPVEKFQPVEHLSPLSVKNNVSLSKLYTLTKISELRYKTTSKQIKSRLEAAGMRSVNLWADLTNYVMLEWGQPFHAFDAEKVGRRDPSLSIEIRSAKRGEKIKTLDGLDRDLIEGDIVIADKAGAIAIAGVMGGEETEVDEGTTEILLEAAIFDPISIRRTARRLGLRSEASNRFEHFLSPDNLYTSLNKILQLYQVYGKGEITGFASVGERTTEPYSVGLTHDKLTRVAGEALPLSKARLYLERLGFKVMSSEKGLLCWPPHFRGDIRIPEDVAEEVLRLHGYENILSKPIQTTLEEVRESKQEDWRDRVTSGLVGNGFSEVKTFPFVSTTVLTHLKAKDLLRLKNPISVEAEYLRPNLLLSLLEVVKRNNPRYSRGRVFELEKIYPKRGENLALGALIWGEKEPFLELKGVLEELGRQAHLKLEFFPVKEEFLHPVKAVEVRVGRERIGVLGEVHPHLTTAFDLPEAAVFEIDFEKFADLAQKWGKFTPISAYPEILEDYSFTLPQTRSLADLIDKIRSSSSLIRELEIKDRFETKEENRSITLKVAFQSEEKGLSSEDISPLRKKIHKLIISSGGQLRS
ncbi:MAG: Phenylalanine-tRNA ligase beta subunit [Candidatus Gottesmanbacteria bacterium GW2011_GWB1_49_7]|uniref:Phenylalanine--tRNA ligase beta subunit n=1 Tax=Candidatus Gottesmanbacteria bacterium GW2011_GWB1_49_7 TaxID=1618448 RepID=A0A0G1VW49_9BACT|nr:MAG: Phenylalanine-tRNA ligase beta subunit [Candidatus Gottesmanbacteria bacterium GW2011_GWB1_49_7]